MPFRRVHVSGELDLATAPRLEERLMALVDHTKDTLEIECSQLRFCDSSGIRVFICIHHALSKQGRECRIVNMPSPVRLPFDALGVTEFLGIAELDSP